MSSFDFTSQCPISEFPVSQEINIIQDIFVNENNLKNIKPVLLVENDNNYKIIWDDISNYKYPSWHDYYEIEADGTLVYKGQRQSGIYPEYYNRQCVFVTSTDLENAKYTKYSPSTGYYFAYWDSGLRYPLEWPYTSECPLIANNSVVYISSGSPDISISNITISRNIPNTFYGYSYFEDYPSVQYSFTKIAENQYRCNITANIFAIVPTTYSYSLEYPYFTKTFNKQYYNYPVTHQRAWQIYMTIDSSDYQGTRNKVRYQTLPFQLKYKVIFFGLNENQYGSLDSYELRTK